MKNRIIKIVSMLAMFTGYLYAYGLAHANEFIVTIPKPTNIPDGMSESGVVIVTIFNAIIGVSGLTFLIIFLVGGVQFIAGAGNEEQTKKEKKMMVDAIIGLIVVSVSYAVSIYILKHL